MPIDFELCIDFRIQNVEKSFLVWQPRYDHGAGEEVHKIKVGQT